MKRISKALSSVVMIALLGLVQNASAREYLVKYRSSTFFTSSTIKSMQVLDSHPEAQLLKVNVPDSKMMAVSMQIANDSNIEYMVPNFKLRSFMRPIEFDTQALRTQWALAKVQAEKAWLRAGNKGSRRVTVAVIDTGADYRHGALSPNMVPGYDFAQNDNDPMDVTGFQNPGHGTHCSGIIGASGMIDGGTQGLSPEVSIMPLRFLDENGSGDLMDGIKAIDYAIAKNVDVISASWGAKVARSEARPLIEAVERAGKAGIPFVVAAANDGANNDTTDYFPTNAGSDNTISVAATGSTDKKPSWSNYGRANVALSAPGEGIISTLPNNKYGDLSGTSMATPLVAGLVALVKAQNPNLNPLEIKSLLQASGDKIGIQVACDCRVNALTAVEMVLNKTMFVSPQAITIPMGTTRQFAGVFGRAPFSYSSSNPNVATIDTNGTLTPVSMGETLVSITDASGKTASSKQIFIGKGGSNGGGGNTCPFGSQKICDLLCKWDPSYSFCAK